MTLALNGAKFGEKYREAALLSAYKQGSRNVVESLISDGVYVNIATGDGGPLLTLAIARGDLVMLDLILNAGADVNIRDTFGNPALVSAIMMRNKLWPSSLSNTWASVNIKGSKWAALHVTAL